MLYRLSYLAMRRRIKSPLRFVAEPTGFEPATFCVTGRYANRYTTAPRAPDTHECAFGSNVKNTRKGLVVSMPGWRMVRFEGLWAWAGCCLGGFWGAPSTASGDFSLTGSFLSLSFECGDNRLNRASYEKTLKTTISSYQKSKNRVNPPSRHILEPTMTRCFREPINALTHGAGIILAAALLPLLVWLAGGKP